ncbi:nucleoside deaminase [bacterium]|jgi:tRNA(adenine34) deaminase|nr:nucleoside deaminase [bacterium]MBT3580951.1 nucleoside deaminase [bacterium]MBT4551957.1 nucleoside deaminase [bacterium]MBT5988527.1 nucleoside deaminase [bacterium]MBT7087424.1 nucleoside deaminase [bacterium]
MTQQFLDLAYKEAQKAFLKNEVPVGAILTKDNKIIARAHNLIETKQDTTAHAELLVIQKASKKLKTWRLQDCTLYTTLEPCPMCAGAIIQARIKNVVFGAHDTKGGAAGSVLNLFENKFNHQVIVTYLNDPKCSYILKDFFTHIRRSKTNLL